MHDIGSAHQYIPVESGLIDVSSAFDSGLIGQIYDIISAFGPLPETAEAICSTLCERLGYRSCAILLERTNQDFLEIEGAAGLSSTYVSAVNSGYPIRIHDPMLSEGPTSEAFRTNRPVAITDIATDVRFRRWSELAQPQGFRSLVSVPLRARNRLIGALNCYHADAHHFTADEIQSLETVAAQIGIAIEIARLVSSQRQTIARLAELNDQLDQQRALVERSEKIHERLTHLVLTSQGIPAVAATLADVIDAPVVVQDCFAHVLTLATPATADETPGLNEAHTYTWLPDIAAATARLALESPVQTPTLGGGHPAWIVAPIVVGRDLLGYVSAAVVDVPAPPLTQRALGHAATVIALEMVKDRLAHETDIRTRGNFTDDLIGGRFDDPNDMRARGRHLGYDLHGPFRVLALGFGLEHRHVGSAGLKNEHLELLQLRHMDVLHQVARDHAPNVLVGGSPGQPKLIVTGVEESRDAVGEVERGIRSQMRRVTPELPVSIGIGRAVSDLSDIPVSAKDAASTLQTIQHLGDTDRTVTFDDLGVARILFQVSDPGEVIAFARDRLAPVLAYDDDHQGVLLDLLGVFLESGLSVALTAERLSVHPNTIRYRIRKIESLLGVSLRDQSSLLDIHLAYTVLRLVDSHTPPS